MKVRAQIFERVCTISGKPIQYAVNSHGAVHRRLWIKAVITGRVRRDGSPTPDGRWDAWTAIDSLPKDARATGKFALIPSRSKRSEDASVRLLRDIFNGTF
jgi:hypothetical protein